MENEKKEINDSENAAPKSMMNKILIYGVCLVVIVAVGFIAALNIAGGQGGSPEFKKVLELAEKGDSHAQFLIGKQYFDGKNIQKNDAEAFQWYEKSAAQGNADGQNALGVCYEKGRGVKQNFTEAVKWSQKAVEQGHAQAMCNLGSCYFRGNGVKQDFKEAVKLYEKAVAKGDSSKSST